MHFALGIELLELKLAAGLTGFGRCGFCGRRLLECQLERVAAALNSAEAGDLSGPA